MTRLTINTPDPGDYYTLDYIHEREAERMYEREEEEVEDPALRISCEEFSDLIGRFWVGSADADEMIAKAHVEAWSDLCDEHLGFDIELEFEDAVGRGGGATATIPIEHARTLWVMSALGGHKALGDDPDWDYSVPPDETTHSVNLLELLQGVLTMRGWGEEDHARDIFYQLADDGLFDQAFSMSVDWEKFNEAEAELRAEMMDEMHERYPDDTRYQTPEYRMPHRCEATPDLFPETLAA